MLSIAKVRHWTSDPLASTQSPSVGILTLDHFAKSGVAVAGVDIVKPSRLDGKISPRATTHIF